MFDANVHVGKDGIKNCEDTQDWGGKLLLALIQDEGLTLVNSEDMCEGMVTRVDPRNGSKSTIDLVICNTFMSSKVKSMVIDECGTLKLKKYGKKVTETDHNSITIKFVLDKPINTQKDHTKEKKITIRNVGERARIPAVDSGR